MVVPQTFIRAGCMTKDNPISTLISASSKSQICQSLVDRELMPQTPDYPGMDSDEKPVLVNTLKLRSGERCCLALEIRSSSRMRNHFHTCSTLALTNLFFCSFDISLCVCGNNKVSDTHTHTYVRL